MVSETQDMSYLDKKQKEDLQRLKQFQSIDSEIFPDRVLEKQDRLRYFYLSEIELERVKIDQKIVVREKDEALLRRLKPQVDAEGLIEPLTVEDIGNNQFLLLAGQHPANRRIHPLVVGILANGRQHLHHLGVGAAMQRAI